MPGVVDVNIFGEGLHVRFNEESEAEVIRKRLTEEGIQIHSLKRISPTIEDAFLSLIPKDQSSKERNG
jgi:ABC-2 type transport system ATP-binding protein